jgi:hypothetical protein
VPFLPLLLIYGAFLLNGFIYRGSMTFMPSLIEEEVHVHLLGIDEGPRRLADDARSWPEAGQYLWGAIGCPAEGLAVVIVVTSCRRFRRPDRIRWRQRHSSCSSASAPAGVQRSAGGVRRARWAGAGISFFLSFASNHRATFSACSPKPGDRISLLGQRHCSPDSSLVIRPVQMAAVRPAWPNPGIE